MIRSLILFIVSLIVLSGCNLSSQAPAEVSAQVDGANLDVDRPTTAPSPTAEVAMKSTPEATAEPTPVSSAPYQCDVDDDGPARRVTADVTVDYANKTAAVREQVVFINRDGTALEDIVLDVQANQWEDTFQLNELSVDESAKPFDLNRNRLHFVLDEPLPQNCQVAIDMSFDLQPAAIRDGLRSYRGFLGYSPRQLNLGHFLPTVAARHAGAWLIHEPIGIGEQIVYEIADWQVNLHVDNAADTLQVAAPGAVTSLGESKWQILLSNSRDFALSLSEMFVVTEQQVAEGATLAVYTFADAEVRTDGLRLDGAAHVLEEGSKAIALFGRRFGAYVNERFVIVQGDFPDGMEFSGLVFVGSAWFYGFDGTPNNYLTLISVHEMAHQWWYARVGNDAAINPWLDEALATYSEYLFIEEYYPSERNWWWSFRVAGFFPQGKVDTPVYEFNTPREYINAIYLRGVQMLHNLRTDIGDDAFFDLLQAYRLAGDGRIAEPATFWSQLPAELHAVTLGTRSEFLHDPGVRSLFADNPPDSVSESS